MKRVKTETESKREFGLHPESQLDYLQGSDPFSVSADAASNIFNNLSFRERARVARTSRAFLTQHYGSTSNLVRPELKGTRDYLFFTDMTTRAPFVVYEDTAWKSYARAQEFRVSPVQFIAKWIGAHGSKEFATWGLDLLAAVSEFLGSMAENERLEVFTRLSSAMRFGAEAPLQCLAILKPPASDATIACAFLRDCNSAETRRDIKLGILKYSVVSMARLGYSLVCWALVEKMRDVIRVEPTKSERIALYSAIQAFMNSFPDQPFINEMYNFRGVTDIAMQSVANASSAVAFTQAILNLRAPTHVTTALYGVIGGTVYVRCMTEHVGLVLALSQGDAFKSLLNERFPGARTTILGGGRFVIELPRFDRVLESIAAGRLIIDPPRTDRIFDVEAELPDSFPDL